MPLRGYHRSQSEALAPNEQAYRRAERELRDFHRARSLDVILEEDHHLLQHEAPTSTKTLTKKRACLCLADLVAAVDLEEEGSETNDNDEANSDMTQRHGFHGTRCSHEDVLLESHHHDHAQHHHSWGHFTAHSSPEGADSHHGHSHHDHAEEGLRHLGGAAGAAPGRIRLPHPAFNKHRTIRRFGRS